MALRKKKFSHRISLFFWASYFAGLLPDPAAMPVTRDDPGNKADKSRRKFGEQTGKGQGCGQGRDEKIWGRGPGPDRSLKNLPGHDSLMACLNGNLPNA